MLPKVDVPLYEITLPLMKKKVKFRPFLVKEEKILLMAAESDDQNAVILAIKQIITNCLVTKIDVDDLPIMDFEYLFLHLRARSVGETIDLQYKCNNDINEGGEERKCNHLVKLSFNALEIEPEINSNEVNKIELTPKLGIVLKYPTFGSIDDLTEKKNVSATELVLKTIISSIDYIYDDESLYYAKDTPKEELVDFVDSLTREQFSQIQNFFENIPKLKKKLDFNCGKCGYSDTIEIEGIQSFFG
jgi:hypothetical protein